MAEPDPNVTLAPKASSSGKRPFSSAPVPRRWEAEGQQAMLTPARTRRGRSSGSIPENRLTRPSSSGRTHHEHARSFRSQGCQTEDGSGVGCLRNISKLKHDVALEQCALPQKIALYPLACNREQGALSMPLSQ